MNDNHLVADSVDLTTPFSGTFLLEDGEALCAAITSGDWVAGGMAAFSLALDGISMALDPIGSLIAMGLGWLMDHLEPLKGWLNDLTGDAGEVAGFATTWQNIAAYLGDAGVALEDSLRTLSGMQGATADAIRAFQTDAGRHLAAAGEWAGAIGTGMSIASAIVKMVHDMTRDAISTIVGSLGSAALTTVVTVGFGAPVAVAQVASKVASLAGKLTKFITNLLKSVKQLIGLVDELMRLFRRLLTSVQHGIRSGSPSPDVPVSRPPDGPDGPAGPRGEDDWGDAPTPAPTPLGPDLANPSGRTEPYRPAPGDTDGGPGRWWESPRDAESAGMPNQVERSGVLPSENGRVMEYQVDRPGGGTVDFDNFTHRGHPPVEVFQEFKGDYSFALQPWMPANRPLEIVEGMVSQASRQADALPPGAVLEWFFETPQMADLAREAFLAAGLLDRLTIHVLG